MPERYENDRKREDINPKANQNEDERRAKKNKGLRI